jgi:hypothetical protein
MAFGAAEIYGDGDYYDGAIVKNAGEASEPFVENADSSGGFVEGFSQQTGVEPSSEAPDDTATTEMYALLASIGAKLDQDLEAIDPAYEHVRKQMDRAQTLEAIRNSRYFVFGCDPKASDHGKRAFKSLDLFKWVEFLTANNSEFGDGHIIIADQPLDRNIYERLMRAQGKNPTDADQETMADARNRARLIGTRDMLFIQSLQDHMTGDLFHLGAAELDIKRAPDQPLRRVPFIPGLTMEGSPLEGAMRNLDEEYGSLRNPGQSQHKRVHLMSELVAEDPEFTRILKALTDLYYSDAFVQKKVLECVPKMVQASGLFEPSYVLFETAATYFLGGTKVGHKGEKRYDNLARIIFEKHHDKIFPPDSSDAQNPLPNFTYYEVPGTEGVVPYRSLSYETDPNEAGLLSPCQGEAPFNQNGPEGWSYINAIFSTIWPIYRNFLGKIKRTDKLNPLEKDEILRSEAVKLVDEFAKQLAVKPDMKYVLKASGVYDVAEGNCQLDELGSYMRNHPTRRPMTFRCREQAGEKPEAYYVRYFAKLMSGMKGPISMNPNMRVNAFGYELKIVLDRLYEMVQEVDLMPPEMTFYDDFWGDDSDLVEGWQRDESDSAEGWYRDYESWCYTEFGAQPMWVDWEAVSKWEDQNLPGTWHDYAIYHLDPSNMMAIQKLGGNLRKEILHLLANPKIRLVDDKGEPLTSVEAVEAYLERMFDDPAGIA